MLLIPGAAALSGFRVAKLVDTLRTHVAEITGLDAWFVHFVDLGRPLSAAERTILERLLTYGPRD